MNTAPRRSGAASCGKRDAANVAAANAQAASSEGRDELFGQATSDLTRRVGRGTASTGGVEFLARRSRLRLRPEGKSSRTFREARRAAMADGFIHTVFKGGQWVNEVEGGDTFGGG